VQQRGKHPPHHTHLFLVVSNEGTGRELDLQYSNSQQREEVAGRLSHLPTPMQTHKAAPTLFFSTSTILNRFGVRGCSGYMTNISLNRSTQLEP
jgi:hypothetical protein